MVGQSKDVLSFFDIMCQRDRPLVWVSTISADGTPHLVPTCFVKPYDTNKIAIGCVFIKQTVENVKRDKRVSLASVRFTEGYDGYMIKGAGEVIDRGEIFDVIKKAVHEASKGKRTIFSVIIVTIDSVYSLKPTIGRKRRF
ncbi:MAG TPA: pyridoxamine 5'-phosphate oxidase family protein [Candidatus Bathyarchaeia archaeon]|nr:pyridoxamine 5'-phosphate oxidase family protein [Candidatus Bathyarchaeia archaeon]